MKKGLLILFFLFSLTLPLLAESQFFVSPAGNDSNPGTKERPFASLEAARDAVRKLQPLKELVTIYLMEGIYFRDKTLALTPQDSGTAEFPITYRAYGDGQVVISGGKVVSGWEKEKGDIWKLHLPEVLNGELFFRQLFADGKRMTRARFPNEGEELLKLETFYDYNPLSLEYKCEVDRDIPSKSLHGRDAELVQIHFWSIGRQRVKTSDARTISTFYPPGCIGHILTYPFKGNPLYIEHAMEFMDRPGEWYLNRDTGWLYYQAAEGENPNTKRFIVPVLEKFVTVIGKKDSPVRNVRFEGITFAHAAWEMPYLGYNGLQAGVHGKEYMEETMYMLKPAIYLEYAQNCGFEMCRLRHTGATGLALGAGCRNNRVLGCEFSDIGGNAVVVGWRKKADDPPRRLFDEDWPDKTDAPVGNVISHNHIHHSATVQFGCVGYFELFSRDTEFTHNLIHHMPYSGVSVGFRWDEVPSTQRNSDIGYNEIHHVMEMLHDGGGVYTLGYQPGTTVHHNYIHDMKSHALYADGGSSHVTFENNVISRIEVHGFQQNMGSYNKVRNNIFSYCGRYALHRNIANDNEPAFIIENNIILAGAYHETDFWWYSGPDEDKDGFLFEKSKSNQYRMDRNLYWDTKDDEVLISQLSFAEHQAKRGKDLHSLVADPKFADPKKDDFALPSDSPAFEIGFEPIDIRPVGPQGKYRAFLQLD